MSMNQDIHIEAAGEQLPAVFLARMAAMLGHEYEAFLASYNRPLRPSLRLGLKATEVQARGMVPFLGEPVPWQKSGFYVAEMPSDALISQTNADGNTGFRPGKHPLHEAGLYYIQEASAMLPASLCPPRPGERVLDLCAAPGGKTTQLATAMGGVGLLVANEIHAGRAAVLSQNVERMGLAHTVVTNESPATLASHFPAFFDKIVVDAPCSGEGMFRKEADAVRMWSPDIVSLCAARQAEILDEAARMLKPNGYLTYSTCTFAPEENEGTVIAFLLRHPDFEVVPSSEPTILHSREMGLLDSGRPEWVTDGEHYPAALLESVRYSYRVFPHHADGEGHFACLLHKKDGNVAPDIPNEPSRSRKKTTKAGTKSLVSEAYTALTAFLKDIHATLPNGAHDAVPCLLGNRLSLVPAALCRHESPSPADAEAAMEGLRVLRAGLTAGEYFPPQRGGRSRFEPDHALALGLTAQQGHGVFELGNLPDPLAAAQAYQHGEILPAIGLRGWHLITLCGLPLGWGKASDGVMKNHYPKGLRR